MTELNIGLLAHVDAGKTTLSEALLWTAGMLRRAGRVDHGDAFLDTETQEKERGITIFSKPARLTWKNQPITLVDTPGHTDFSGETERALWVLDCAVLVISGSEGVQGHTLTLWRLLESYRVPAVIFVNKCDMPGADKAAVLRQLQRQLSDGCQDLSTEEGLENAAGQSEMTMEQYLTSGTVEDAALRQLVTERRLFPVCFGSALKGDGIPELLDTLLRLAPQPSYPADFGARIYKIGHDAQGTRLAFLKVTGGCLRAREELRDPAGEWVEKVNQLRLYSGARFTPVSEAGAGTICAVTGLSQVKAGDALGAELPAPTALLEPAFAYEVLTEDDPAEVLQ